MIEKGSMCLTEQKMEGMSLDGPKCKRFLQTRAAIYQGSAKVWLTNKFDTNQINRTNLHILDELQMIEKQVAENSKPAEAAKKRALANKRKESCVVIFTNLRTNAMLSISEVQDNPKDFRNKFVDECKEFLIP